MGDFSVLPLNHGWGFLVTSHDPNLMTFIATAQLPSQTPAAMAVGLFGRSMRQRDSASREIVHVATKAPPEA